MRRDDASRPILRSHLEPFVAAVLEPERKHAILVLATSLVALALALTTFTAARGLYPPAVVIASGAFAIYYGNVAGVSVAAVTGLAFVALSYFRQGMRGSDLLLTSLAVPLWMLIVAAVGAFAAALRRRDAALVASTRELAHRALHDPLTGLPNRELFLDRLSHAVLTARRHDTCAAVLFLDVDKFKEINDALGHAAGDEVLVEVARRMLSALRAMDTAARLGGDEFAVVCEDLPRADEADGIAERVRRALAQPWQVGGRDITVGVSIGLAVSCADDRGAFDLLRSADAAMYEAKRSGGGQIGAVH